MEILEGSFWDVDEEYFVHRDTQYEVSWMVARTDKGLLLHHLAGKKWVTPLVLYSLAERIEEQGLAAGMLKVCQSIRENGNAPRDSCDGCGRGVSAGQAQVWWTNDGTIFVTHQRRNRGAGCDPDTRVTSPWYDCEVLRADDEFVLEELRARGFISRS